MKIFFKKTLTIAATMKGVFVDSVDKLITHPFYLQAINENFLQKNLDYCSNNELPPIWTILAIAYR